MSYLVLARKWRPQGFEDLIGQEPIVRVLKNSIEQGKIAHAYLFSGPRGVGKTSTARILAKSLNCTDGPTSTPCDACVFCTSITDGSSIDVIEIDGASNNSVNDIRDLRERVKYVPSGGRYKIYIIDETHMLSDAAFNALLKTLEEPPAHVVFVLATTAPKKIPPTVLSRCQHLLFRRIPGNKIKERIKRISDSEGIRISSPAIELIARAADGSLRDALTILDQISSFSADISEIDVKDLLGITDFGLLSKAAKALIEGNREELLQITTELTEKGVDVKSFAKEIIQFFRDLLVASVVKKPEDLLDMGGEELETLKKILSEISQDQLTLYLSELMKAELDIRNASSPRLAFEMSLLKISFLSELKPLKEMIENLTSYTLLNAGKENHRSETVILESLEGEKNNDRIVTESESKPEKTEEVLPSEGISQELDTLQTGDVPSINEEIWDRILRRMDPPLSSKMSKAEHKFVEDKLILTFNGGDSIFVDSIKKHMDHIQQAAVMELGQNIKIELKTAKKKLIRKKDLKEEVMEDPTIKEVLELFDGRIVDVLPTTEDKGG